MLIMVDELASFALSTPVSFVFELEAIVSPLVVWIDDEAFEFSFGICTFVLASPFVIVG